MTGRPDPRALAQRVAKRLAVFLVALVATLASVPPASAAWTSVDAGRGSVPVRYPGDLAPGSEAPLVVLLHGYGASGAIQESYLQLGPWLESEGFVFTFPDGTVNQIGKRFWNATDACCDFWGSGVDDAGYLVGLIDAIDAAIPIDRRRILFFGHSNGGFMAYRMACQHAELAAGAASLAGATFLDPADCAPTKELQILQIHGTDDASVPYDGGQFSVFPSFPGALQSVATWAGYAGCANQTTAGGSFDADSGVAGEETEIVRYATGCGAGGAELWTIVGGEHIPPFTDEFRARVTAWFVAAASKIFADGFDTGSDAAWTH